MIFIKMICSYNNTKNLAYENIALMSPLISASSNGVPRQAGTRYNRAGCACLNMCITNIVANSPMK